MLGRISVPQVVRRTTDQPPPSNRIHEETTKGNEGTARRDRDARSGTRTGPRTFPGRAHDLLRKRHPDAPRESESPGAGTRARAKATGAQPSHAERAEGSIAGREVYCKAAR